MCNLDRLTWNCCDQVHQPHQGFCNIPKIVTRTVKLWCLHGSDVWRMGQLFRFHSLTVCHRPIIRCCFTVTPTMFSKAQVFLTDLFCLIFLRKSEFEKETTFLGIGVYYLSIAQMHREQSWGHASHVLYYDVCSLAKSHTSHTILIDVLCKPLIQGTQIHSILLNSHAHVTSINHPNRSNIFN